MLVANTADLVFSLFNLFLWLAVLVAVVVFGLMVFLIIRYRERDPSAPEPEDAPTLGKLPEPRGKLKTVLISVGLSTIILTVLVIGVPGVVVGTFEAIDRINNPPQGTLRIQVVGFQWAWKFTYPSGYTDTVLRVPVGEVVILDVTGQDVFHNFGVIEFKVKTDAIPGRTNTIWFVAREAGEYTVQCFEFCGLGHAFMKSKVIVMEADAFQSWYGTVRGGR